MVFGKREPRTDEPQEDVIGSLYGDTASEPSTSPTAASEYRREPTEGVLDAHARFNGKFVSDRDLRIDGEAQGEIECQGTLVLSPQARVRAGIKAHNVVVNGDYEGNVDSGGRFEIGSTGRVKGEVKTQVLVIKEGAFFEGAVIMARKAPAEGAGKAGSGGASTSADSAEALATLESAPIMFTTEVTDEPTPAGAATGGRRQPTGPGDADR